MTEPDSARTAAEALARTDRFSLAGTVGGWRGVLDSGLPGVVFVVVYTATRDLATSAWSAVGLSVVMAAVRLVRRESLLQVASGVIGIGICAWIAMRSGRAQDFYLPGLLTNAGYAAAYAVSVLVRWPLLGLVVETLRGAGTTWRQEPGHVRAYSLASWLWVGMFLTRIAVQLPLWAAGLTGALGVARVAMGLPLFALTVWLSWLVLRREPALRQALRPGSARAEDEPEVRPDDRAGSAAAGEAPRSPRP